MGIPYSRGFAGFLPKFGVFSKEREVLCMNYSFLIKNQSKRKNFPLWQLFCFAMFCFWQMGFIYFIGPALTINGRTPLPIDMDNVATLIAICYVLSILIMIFLPRFVVWVDRIGTIVALMSAIGLFLPFSDGILRLLIYVNVFCCCLMIGFETFVIVNYFSEKSAIYALTAGYGLALALIALVQNDFLPITFPVFRIVTVAALLLLLLFFFKLPGRPKACPGYVKKGCGLLAPKKMMYGTFLLAFVCSMMAVSGPSIAGEIRHGVFITYCVDALASLLIFIFYKKTKFHPFHAISACIGLGCLGFLLMLVVSYLPWVSCVACALIGMGMVSCQMLPLFGLVLMKSYPSRFISPIIIGLALVAVLVQSSMVELFRGAPTMLYLTYAVVMVVLAIIYLQIAPFFQYSFGRELPKKESTESSVETESAGSDPHLSTLSKRELEVVDLIATGYSNAEIASALYISAHTVNDHTKNIYRKLNVHSRMELVAYLNHKKSS